MKEFFTEREISALHRENSGPHYNRLSVIIDRFIEAHIEASLKQVDICKFRNKWGWCKLEKDHGGQHTVIYLGDDD